MLSLKNITKDYQAGTTQVHALKNVSLDFRKSEFVSILGPSGCGKTTMLNIIGGLDQYTDGDLIINGRSTKDFKDRDWDGYRNHSVGFVFQSYNLIPHQSVLQNVELALSLSGVSKAERRQRAKAALERVGLGDQLKKRPSEMSGGQMQRVAIARAIVNDPDIVLADEPTGALDSETSVQVMEILKEISADRLVIMVTHNPDLAEKYSTRIVRMLDGEVLSDTAPLSAEELQDSPVVKKEKKSKKKPSMSFATSFGLSLKNLFTKKGRTILTSFAGSIGIIGIALIFAVSNGVTAYINSVQENTLSSYPLTIEATTVDVSTLMQTFMGVAEDATVTHENDKVYSQSVMVDMITALNSREDTENDLKSFKSFIDKQLDDETGDLYKSLSGVQYTYNFDLLVYTKDENGDIVYSDTKELLSKALAENLSLDTEAMMNAGETMGFSMDSSSMSMMGGSPKLWNEMLTGKDGSLISPVLESQYDVVYGSWPNSKDEIVLVLNENNELDDLTLYALGLETKAEIDAVFDAVKNKEKYETKQRSWSYEELCNMEFRVVLNADCYSLDEKTDLYKDLRNTESGLRYLYDNAMKLKVSGIIRPSENASSHMLSGSIGYTKDLTDYLMAQGEKDDAIQAQLKAEDTDIFTGLPFKTASGSLSDAEKETEFKNYIKDLDESKKAEAYINIMSIPAKEQVDAAVSQAKNAMTREQMEEKMAQAMSEQVGMSEDEISKYIADMSDEDLDELIEKMVSQQIREQMSAKVKAQMSSVPQAQLAAMLDQAIDSYTKEQCAVYYDEVLTFSESTYEDNLQALGYVTPDDPSAINLYASSFENKDVVEEVIAEYNESVEELSQIHYTDYVGIMLSSITTIINAITYVLISFVAISLIVSSIMIGVITLISVQERTKEIGILRAIGASKKNVSGMFNAETIIIGFTSGLIGVGVTYLLCIPINAIIQHLTGIPSLAARLPIGVAVGLIVISMLLTLLAGIIPSRSAAKKDPVVALRTE